MKISALLFICILTLNLSSYSQNKDAIYTQKAEEIKNKIWGDEPAEFKVKNIPAAMENESAVIIASSFSVEQTSNSKLKMSLFMPLGGTKTTKLSIYRERVKINDKAALLAFSTVEYQKTLNRSVSLFYMKNVDKKDTYIGAKIIKTNGQEVIVNTDEEVLTKNDEKNKQGKLAIPDLQVGDILDYYVARIELTDQFNASVNAGMADQLNNDYVWVLANEYPTLVYDLNLHYNSKINVNYISANNAPDFTETTADNGDKIYSLQIKNMPRYDSNLWTSVYRQYPYIQLTSSYNKTFAGFAKYDKNESRLDNTVKTYIASFDIPKIMVYSAPEEVLKSYYKSGKALRNAPLDSSMAILYNAFKFKAFCEYGTDNMDMSTDRNDNALSSRACVVSMAHMLHDLDIDYDVILLSPRTTSTLDNVFDLNDVKALIRVNNDGKPLYMCFDDMFTQFNEIPASYQGEQAILLSPHKRDVAKFDQDKTVIPVVDADKNYINSSITFNMIPGSMQKVKMTRTVTEFGSLRHDDQHDLVLLEDYDDYFYHQLNQPELAKRLSSKFNKKTVEEFNNAFAKARTDIADNFKEELKNEFGEEPTDFTYKLLNIGLSDPNPVFSYSNTFTMGNFVKTAGNNYIIEVGKLVGTVTTVEDKHRQRKIDVYMSSARSFGYDINIDIPKGYQVKGLEGFNKQVKNETGSLLVTASVKGNTLNLKIKRSYIHNFEKAAQWPKLVELIDAMSDLSKQKVLLEKI